MPTFKPMLAASCDDLNLLTYPLLATPKIDGIRCLIIGGVAMSRSLKPIPNRYIQSILGKAELNGLDGELLVGTTFQDATSGIMSVDGQPDFRFYVFDRHDLGNIYVDRVHHMKTKVLSAIATFFELSQFLVPLVTTNVRTRTELDNYFAACLSEGHEGVMVRSADGPYKHGRATFKEGYLTKLKPFEDAEATVVGFEERMHNANVATTNALGRTERSSHQANLVPMGTLGALIVKNEKLWPNRTFNLGTGFTDAQRAKLWEVRNLPWIASGPLGLIGQTAKFKYQAIGTKDKPRIPVFLGFRDSRDL